MLIYTCVYFLIPASFGLILSGRQSILGCPKLTHSILHSVNTNSSWSVNNLASIMINHSYPLAHFLYQRKLKPEEAYNIFSTFIKYKPENHQVLLPMRHCMFDPYLRYLIFTHWAQYFSTEIYLLPNLMWSKRELDLVATRLIDNPQIIGSEGTSWISFGSNNPFYVDPNVPETEKISSFYFSSQSMVQYEFHRSNLLKNGMNSVSLFEQNMLVILRESEWISKIQANILKIVEIFSNSPKWGAHWHALIILTVLNVAEIKENNSLKKEDRRNIASLIVNYLQDISFENMCLSQICEILNSGAKRGLRLSTSPIGHLRGKLNRIKSICPIVPSICGSISDYLQSWRHFLYSKVSNIGRIPTVITDGSHLVQWWVAYYSKDIEKTIHLSSTLPYSIYFAKSKKYYRKLSTLLHITHSLLIKHSHLFEFDGQTGYFEWNSVDRGKIGIYFWEAKAFSRFILTYLAFYSRFPFDLSPAVVADVLMVRRRDLYNNNNNTDEDVLKFIRGLFSNSLLFNFLPTLIRSEMVQSQVKHK